LLSCTTVAASASLEVVCCRLAPFHGSDRVSRSRRYPSDTTDAQWALIDPLLPDPAWLGGQGGRREVHCRRVIVDAIFYLVDNGIKWRALPVDFPSWSTVYNYFAAWETAGVTQRVLDELRDRVRLREGRTAEPSAAIIDSQSVKAAETVGTGSRGYDAGKKTSDAKDCQAAAGSGSWVGMGKAVASSNVTRCARQWWRQPIMRLKRLRWAAV